MDPETRANTMAMIKRSVECDAEEEALSASEDSDEEDDMEKRFAGIDLEVDELDQDTVQEILNRLTGAEREEFEKLIDTGDIMNLVPAHEFWTPWWSNYRPVLIEEIGGASNGNESAPEMTDQAKNKAPEIAADIPALSSLTSKPVSPLVKNSVANVILSYSYVCRYFNGDHQNQAFEAVAELLAVSAVLREAAVTFDDSRASVQAAIQCLMTTKGTPIAFIIELLEDTKKIACKVDIALRALSDLVLLIGKAIKEIKADAAKKEERSKLKLLLKKAEFLLSWAREKGPELEGCLLDIDIELTSMKGHEKVIRRSHSFIKENSSLSECLPSKVLIEEI